MLLGKRLTASFYWWVYLASLLGLAGKRHKTVNFLWNYCYIRFV